jgi:GTPase SAR1 family protein
VQSVRGTYSEYQFTCVACKKDVIPERNVLIEKHIIWKSMCKLYGIQSLLDLKINLELISCNSILKNITIRYIHLKSQLNILQSRIDLPSNQAKQQDTSSLFDEFLVNDVKDLCYNLEKLVERIEITDQQMNDHGIIVSECLEKYKNGMKHFDHLCHSLVESMVKLQTVEHDNVTSNLSSDHEDHIKDLYRIHDLDKLSSEQNIEAIDGILQDIDFRHKCLSPRIHIISELLKEKPDGIKFVEKDLEQAKKKLEIISNVEEELKNLRPCLQMINQYITEYDRILRDDQYSDIPCSKFILLLEKMRVRIEQLEVLENFPQTIQLMNNWQNDYGTDEEFKPKVIDLCKTIESDVQHLFSDYNWIYSVPYKVGVIGHGSVGKSALVMKLSEIEEFSSMIAVERSTFGYLQFDTLVYKDPRNSNKIIPITFVDVEGATDTDESVSIGNYLELINKADCDMYIIAFDDLFNGHNRTCQKYIENNLKRKCILVRSKADLLFNQYFPQTRQEKEDYQIKIAFSKMRNQALKTFDDQSLIDDVYLTAAVCDNKLKDAYFVDFDLKKLKEKLVQMAITDFRGQRISDLATRAAITVINTCFRRGYSVTQTKYKWLAAGTSIIPFLDEVPKYFGRKKIRHAFGIQNTHAECQTNDSFEKYLREKKLTVPKEYLRSGEFKYLISRNPNEATTTNIHGNQTLTSRNTSAVYVHQALNVARHSFVVLGAIGRVADDAVRIVAPTATVTLRTVSIAGIVIGAVLTPVFAAWSFYSAGQSMNRELHSVCDDLVIILQCFIVDRCNDCFQNIKLPMCPPFDKDTSSSDKD